MRLTEDVMAFLGSPVMIIIGTSDESNRPAIGRGIGISMRRPDEMDVVFSRWQWAETAANIAATGLAAITVARPSDYVSYQVKGHASLQPADAQLAGVVAGYRAAIRPVLSALGIPAAMIDEWIVDRDPVAARLSVREAYVQTPGPRAGTVI